ncbi:hypothetical protein NQ176_g8259 [Zarea fungicola]|uniref:Uncharacterized protein n=1 Tax=Zarea fungicola TaxID=93591 RepID=A0ACC1MVA3_9HYPO|nr:hypothetical protein NQ176_g8259 [Lecanicillium fungicola]
MANVDSEKVTLTDGEMRILKAIFANMQSKPVVDWDAAASAASLGNAKSIKERYRQMCIRLGWNKKTGGDAGSSRSTPKKKKSTTGSSPCKVTKRSPRAVKKKPQYNEEDDNVDKDVEVKEEDVAMVKAEHPVDKKAAP